MTIGVRVGRVVEVAVGTFVGSGVAVIVRVGSMVGVREGKFGTSASAG
jgi:hypothetical protein